jgi:hypothetical protein
MKRKFIFLAIVATLIFNLIIGCVEKQKPSDNNKVNVIKKDSTPYNSFEKYKKRHNLTSNSFEDYKTKYKDGRKSEIRMLFTYESFDDTLILYPKDKTKIVLVVIEWNKNEGIVATESASFANQNNNQMNGGDVETNRRMLSASKKFIKFSEQYFDKNFDKLTKIEEIPNRELDSVSFDFITNKGIFTVQENLKKLENNTSIWSLLFEEGKKLKLEVVNTINTNEWKGK